VSSAVSQEGVCDNCAMWISNSISQWTTQLSIYLCLIHEIGAERCVCKGKTPGWASVCDETVDTVCTCFQHSPQKSMHQASCKLQLPQTTIPKMMVALPHFHKADWNHLNAHLTQKWVGHAWANNAMWCRRPPRLPNLTPCNFFLWGYIKYVFVLPLPQLLPELR
jgi:hypothetical protein